MAEELLYQMNTQATVMRLAGKLMLHHFAWRHEGSNFANFARRRRQARRKLATLAKRYLDAAKAERDLADEIELAIQRAPKPPASPSNDPA